MKLSDEQREELTNYLDQTPYKFVTKEELYNDIAEGKRLLYLLQASEQAWKSEAERLSMELRVKSEYAEQLEKDNYHAEANLSHIDGLLNQAVEVLTWIRDAGTDYQSNHKASEFLSTLSQEGDKP